MAGIFDLHALMALQNGWADLTSARFSSMFKGLPTDVVNSWYTALKSEGVEFSAAYATGESNLPTVVIKSSEDRADIQPLGFYGRTDATTHIETWGVMVDEEATIYIFSSSAEWTRALYVAMRGIMISSTKWFIKECHYDSVEFTGGGDIDPDRDLVAEDMIFTRIQRWSAKSISEAQAADYSSLVKPTLVGNSDAVIDGSGNKGSVTGAESV